MLCAGGRFSIPMIPSYFRFGSSYWVQSAFYLGLCWAGISNLTAQPLAFKGSAGPTVQIGTDTLEVGFAGGFNSPQFSTIDLNGDGLEDLVVFDRSEHRILPFVRITAQSPRFVYGAQYVDSFPRIEHWMQLYDYDCDGRKDLFCSVSNGVGVYRNSGTGNQLRFEWALGNWQYLPTDFGGTSGITNLKVPVTDFPAIADFDRDNAVDILTFSQLGINIEHHRNLQPCGLDFYLKTDCWGGVLENFSNNSVQIDACDPGKAPWDEVAQTSNDPSEKVQHSGSTLTALDLNGDNRLDLLLGDVSYNNVTALYNDGSADTAHVSIQDSTFPQYNTPANVFVFPTSSYIDYDGDGKRDLMVGPNIDASVNDSSAWYYRNLGTDAAPVFAFQSKNGLQSEMVDIGERARPVLFDWDQDGLLDLFISGTGSLISSGVYRQGIWYFRNIGDTVEAVFQLQTKNFGNFANLGLGTRLHPAMGDLSGDGVPDVMVGTGEGLLYAFEQLSNGGFALMPSNINGLDVGNEAAPALFDLTGDGLLDLLVGEDNGNINYFEQFIGATFPAFVLVNERFGAIDMKGTLSGGLSVPALYAGADGVRLMVGSYALGISEFDSLSNGLNLPSTLTGVLGNGTQASTDYKLTPFGESKKSGRNQFLIKASELSAAGLVMGTVESLGFEVSGSNHSPIDQGVSVRMKLVPARDSLTTFETSGFSEVIQDGFQPLILTSGWNDLVLHRNFTWDGTSDVLVEVCFSRNSTSVDIPVRLHDAGFKANAYGDISNHNTNTANGCTQPFQAASSLRPNMRWVVRPQVRTVAEHSYTGQYLAPALGDLNSDGKPDLIVRGAGGGLRFFEGTEYVAPLSTPELRHPIPGLIVLPNPNSGRFRVVSEGLAEGTVLGLFDLQGRELSRFEYHPTEEVTVDLASGIYLIRTLEVHPPRHARWILR